MRILHVTEYCHAGSIGGTERYVLDLINGLAAAGVQNVIGWLQSGHSTATLGSEGVRIITLPAPPMRVDAPPSDFHQAAVRLLESERPDLLHFHTFGLTEAALAKLAKQRGIPYAFTYHSPAWTCRNDTLLFQNGVTPCDGEVLAWRCSACLSQQRLGIGTFAGHVATAISLAGGWVGLPLGATSLRRRTAFFYDSLRYARVLRSFLGECDLAVSCCDWSGPVLRRNGTREHCMIHCPQGVSDAVAAALHAESKTASASAVKEFVIGYVGRIVEIKGVHILMEGFSRMAGEEARLRIVGWDADHTDLPYARRVRQLAQADSRIELVPKKSFGDTLAEYHRLSLLAIPSIWMETGPLTLLEARALDVPVFGSNRLGQLNLLREYGRIVEPNTPAGWQAALTDAFTQWKQGAWSKKGTGLPIRTMTDVSREMATCYRGIVAN
jgi:glycosyltransferase involved in cell wall biosynthesis